MIENPKKIVISRTDSIGDVILTLPIAGILKKKYPETKVVFLGNTYTKPIINCSAYVDEIWEWRELEKLSDKEQISWLKEQNIDVFIHVFPRKKIAALVKKAQIPNRIGTSHRLFHLWTCNYRPNFTRKHSDLHEAQLNTKLLQPLGIIDQFELNELAVLAGFNKIQDLPEQFAKLLNAKKKNIIFHPKSQGSAKEWEINNYIKLAESLDSNSINIFFTGTEKEAHYFRHLIPKSPNIFDLSGQMTLDELIAFISKSDLLLAASTGPLHIAGVTGINVVGLFSPQKPIHAERWKPIGNEVIIVSEKKISDTNQPLNIDLRDVKKAIENIV